MKDINALEKHLQGAIDDFENKMNDMSDRLDQGVALSQADLVRNIKSKTVECLSDFKTAIIEAYND